jgi:uncharacterized membrane protein
MRGLIATVLVVALAAGVAMRYGAQRLDGFVAATVERYGSAVTGTDVDVDGAELALTAGRATLAGVTIDNPGGYQTDYAVKIDHASVEIDVASLTGDVPVVEEIVLDGALINAEIHDTASNLTDIQRRATSAPTDSVAADEPDRLVVERFRLTNARVLVTSRHLQDPEELLLEDVMLEGIGGTTGATYPEVAEAMLLPIVAAAQSAAVERLRSRATDAVSDSARDALQESVDDLREDADEAQQELSDSVEELLDRG